MHCRCRFLKDISFLLQLVCGAIVLNFIAVYLKVKMGSNGGGLLTLAFSLCMLSSVNGNHQVSNGLHGQRQMAFVEKYRTEIQGDHSTCSKPIVDIDLKVAFYYKVIILKRNFQINVKGRF